MRWPHQFRRAAATYLAALEREPLQPGLPLKKVPRPEPRQGFMRRLHPSLPSVE
jgi:hypothetical protein